MIELKNIKKTYNNQVVVDVDELSLEEGKFYSLIGSNGSGKSTFAKILAGIIRQDNGKLLHILKKIEDDGTKKYFQIGYLPQKAYMFDMNLERNIKVGYNKENDWNYANESRINETFRYYIERKVDDMITKFGLEALRKKNAKKFSGGEQQKVALARFMMQDFDLAILDEPTSAMDKESETVAEKIIRNYAKDKTLILITHELDQARRFTEDKLVMNSGKIV